MTPATATYNSGLFVLTGLTASANAITISSPSDSSVQIVLGNGDTFTSAPTGAAFALSQTNNPNDTLTINPALATLSTFQVNLGNANDTLVVGLDGVGVGNLVINTGSGNDQTTFNTVNITGNLSDNGGTISLATGAAIATNGGAITLTATGPNAALTVNGNVSSGNGAATLQATGNVTIGANDRINVGTGVLNLAADVNVNGTGDDGVGTLTVSAGAQIYGASINLRGAEVAIAPTAAVGSVGTAQTLSTFVTGLSFPQGLAFDASGDLFIANGSANTVSEVLAGTTTVTPYISAAAGLSNPRGMAFDASGDLFIASAFNNEIFEVPAGTSTATPVITSGLDDPRGIAFDASGNLYIANSANSTISRVAAGTTTATSFITSGLSTPFGLVFDASGNLFITNQAGDSVDIVGAGTDTATAFASGGAGLSAPQGMAIDTSGNLYIASTSNSTVPVVAAGSTTITPFLTSGLSGPRGLAFDSSGNLYITNQGGNAVQKVTPAIAATTEVTIQSSLPSRPMSIGGNNGAAVAGINLTSAELADIVTAADGTITIGDSSQTGNITFSGATVATTAGAATVVMQSTSGAGGIILDPTNGIPLNGNGGTVTLTPGTGQLSATLSSNAPLIASNGFDASGLTLALTLNFVPTSGTPITLISDTGSAITGNFSNLTAGGTIAPMFEGTAYPLGVSYTGGEESHDLVLNPIATVTVSTGSLNLGSTPYGTAGSSASYVVSGVELTGNLAIAAPSGVQISTDGTTWSTTLTLTPENGTVASTTIYARLSATDAVGNVSGNIQDTSPGATEQDVLASGTVTGLPLTLTGTAGNDQFVLRMKLDDETTLEYSSDGGATFTDIAAGGVSSVNVSGLAGNDSLTLDLSNGLLTGSTSNLPVTFDGGTGIDYLIVKGNPDDGIENEVFTASPASSGAGTLTLAADGPSLTTILLNTTGIQDTLPVNSLTINAGALNNAIQIGAGPTLAGVATNTVRGIDLNALATPDQLAQANTNNNGNLYDGLLGNDKNDLTGQAFLALTFANKTGVTINGQSGDDLFILSTTTPAAGLQNLTLDGGTGFNILSARAPMTTVTTTLLNIAATRSSTVDTYVARLYELFLGRNAANSELSGWESVAQTSGLAAVAQGIEQSQEARAFEVEAWYRQYLGRAASQAEANAWAQNMINGMTDEQVLSSILGGQEFFARAQTLFDSGSANENFVSALYLLALNRTGSAAEVNGWVQDLPSLGAGGVAMGFVTSGEFLSDLAAGLYGNLLHRTASPQELQGWSKSGLGMLQIREGFIEGAEFEND